jgi:hypothetical protein
VAGFFVAFQNNLLVEVSQIIQSHESNRSILFILLHPTGSPESLGMSDAYHQNKINISGILFEMKE